MPVASAITTLLSSCLNNSTPLLPPQKGFLHGSPLRRLQLPQVIFIHPSHWGRARCPLLEGLPEQGRAAAKTPPPLPLLLPLLEPPPWTPKWSQPHNLHACPQKVATAVWHPMILCFKDSCCDHTVCD